MIQSRLVTGALAVMVSARLIGAIPAQGPALVSHPVVLIAVHMVTPTTGWGLTDQAVVRTANGGTIWQDVTPPGYPPPFTPRGYAMASATAFLDTGNAWVAWWQSRQAVIVSHTSDGGRTWAHYRAGVFPKPSAEAGFPLQLIFTDSYHGWVAVSGEGMLDAVIALARTTDGGRQWKRIAQSLPIARLLGFRSATTGWGSSSPASYAPTHFIYVTRDGGRTWQRQGLPVPAGSASNGALYGRVSFSNARNGVLPATLPSMAGLTLEAYVTHDDGQRWQATVPLVLPRTVTTVLTNFVGSRHGWVLAWGRTGPASFYATSDGAQHWHPVMPNVPLRDAFQLDFVTNHAGFVLVRHATTGHVDLLTTHDGGHTWVTRHPQGVR